MFKVGIIGSNGLIGQSILKFLANNEDYEIFTFNRSYPKKDNYINVTSYVGEISDSSEIFNKFLSEDFNQIIHLGESPTYDINYLLSQQLLFNKIIFQKIKQIQRIEKFIYISSIAVYGDGEMLKENALLNAKNDYGFIKNISENIFNALINFGKKVIIFRPANVYGEDGNSGFIYDIIEKISLEQEISIYGDGKNTRQYIHANDCAEGIIKSLPYNKSIIFNISGNQEVSINDIISILKTYTSYEIVIKYLDSKNMNSTLTVDTSLIQKELNWTPQIDIVTGLGKILGKKFM